MGAMSNFCLLHRDPLGQGAGLRALLAPAREAVDVLGGRRAKIWDLSGHLHCSIVGTCLTAHELRQVFVRLGDADARAASDHALHGRGVRAASRRDEGGKFLHKTLDKRHEAAIRRFGKAATPDALRALWAEALDQGEIAGPYWAVLTHPATSAALVQDVFGDVHMLSHQVGAAARLDIARLRRLERDLGERDDKIARQEARLQATALERETLRAALARLEAALAGREPVVQTDGSDARQALESLRRDLAEERARGAALAERLRSSEARRLRAETEGAQAAVEASALRREVAALEDVTRPAPAGEAADDPSGHLRGVTILYVGGRPKLIEQLRAFVVSRGGALLSHDGGVDDNAALLPGLVYQADVVFFPVDCVSHAAAEQVKRLCRRVAKPWSPLRSASLASFVAQLRARPDLAEPTPAAAAE
jgi:hypothetical protein